MLRKTNAMSGAAVPMLCAPICCVQAKLYPRLLAAMKPGATLGLSHGFLLGVMKSDNVDFRKDINVVLMAPKVRVGKAVGTLRNVGEACAGCVGCGSGSTNSRPSQASMTAPWELGAAFHAGAC